MVIGVAIVVAAPEIGMPAGLRQRLAADHQTRALDQPLFLCLDECMRGTTQIAHRGEAAIEHALHDPLRMQRHQRIGQHRVLPQMGDGGDHMHMAIDQTGHQGAPFQIDFSC